MVTSLYFEKGDKIEIIDLPTAKKQLRIEDSFEDEDDLIQQYIDASLQVCENFINRSINPRTFFIELDQYQKEFEFSENYDNDTINKIEYKVSENSDYLQLDSSSYKLKQSIVSGVKKIIFNTDLIKGNFPGVIKISINQGLNIEKFPLPIKQAMLLIISDMYERRDDREIGTNSAANALLRPYRKY